MARSAADFADYRSQQDEKIDRLLDAVLSKVRTRAVHQQQQQQQQQLISLIRIYVPYAERRFEEKRVGIPSL